MIKENISDLEKIAFLQIARSKNIGPVTFAKLFKRYNYNIFDILKNKNYLEKSYPNIKIIHKDIAEKEFIKIKRFNADIISYNDVKYPSKLREIYNPPILLTYKGDISLLNSNIIAVVGSRNPSISGQNFAKQISKDMSNLDIVAISGLAMGVDSIIHRYSSNYKSIAVIAGGINNIYPYQNKDLYSEIYQNGLILSENIFDQKVKNTDFPRRNRIISAISDAIIIIEAKQNSGTLITAKYAIEQNKDIFVMPGCVFDPRYKGSHKLIKEGAKLIENIYDILEENIFTLNNNLNISADKNINKIAAKKQSANNLRNKILDVITHYELSKEEIFKQLDNIDITDFNQELIMLEMENIIICKMNKISLNLQ